jgi:hypothetical protein
MPVAEKAPDDACGDQHPRGLAYVLAFFVQRHNLARDRVKVDFYFLANFVGTVNLPALSLGDVQFFHIVFETEGFEFLRHLRCVEPFRCGLIGALGACCSGAAQREAGA